MESKETAGKEENPIRTIDAYIAGFPERIRLLLTEMRTAIRESAPDATEKISYRIPTFDFHGALVHFAANKHHIGFYPTPSGIRAFREELRPYKTTTGTVQFPFDQPLPLDLIRRITAFRVLENQKMEK
jgi:uncharacterized protein YdhG (YjbR/CyaY superfamily)